jgi:hypothetical protein
MTTPTTNIKIRRRTYRGCKHWSKNRLWISWFKNRPYLRIYETPEKYLSILLSKTTTRRVAEQLVEMTQSFK